MHDDVIWLSKLGRLRWQRERVMKTILVADDAAPVRQLIRTVLELAGGYQVLEAGDGVQALQLALLEHPSLVILDRRMAGLTGDEVCVELRAQPATRTVPVLIVTSVSGDDVQGYVLGAGASAILHKPFHPDELVSTVKKLLGE
jgi:CheY-like chemotaxis protein